MIDIQNLTINHKTKTTITPIVENISFKVGKGECVGILGESGSGKSMTCKGALGLLQNPFEVSGTVLYEGKDILKMQDEEKRALRGKEIGMILQHPMTAFNPLFTIQNQVVETLRLHLKITKKQAIQMMTEAFMALGLTDVKGILSKYPNELSGGMLQRVMIALSLSLGPKCLIADEPTTAIDTLNQLEVLEAFKKLQKLSDLGMIFITHDLGVMANLTNRIVVMEKGKIVEQGETSQIIYKPNHPYTKYLVETRMKLTRQFAKMLG